MANSASDARHSEADIRKSLIEKNLIYGMLTLPSNMFYTVTLPATLWFFDKGKQDHSVLCIDARNIFTQRDRAHRVKKRPYKKPRILSREKLEAMANDCSVPTGKSGPPCLLGQPCVKRARHSASAISLARCA